MAITYHEYKFLSYSNSKRQLGDVLTLGRTALLFSTKDLLNINRVNQPAFKEKFCEKLLNIEFNAKSVVSADYSKFEGANFIMDMNKSIYSKKKYDTIIDFGTSEHIFNVTQCFKNISYLCKKGGQILHILPTNNYCGHGFWQFSPEIFFSLYNKKNGFLETEVFLIDYSDKNSWWKILKQNYGERLELTSKIPLSLAVRTVKKFKTPRWVVQQSDYQYAWSHKQKKYMSQKNNISKFFKKVKDYIKVFLRNNLITKNYYSKIEFLKLSENKDFKKKGYLKKINFDI